MKLSKYIKQFNLNDEKVVLFNTLTGAIDVMNGEMYDSLKNGNFKHINSETITQLKMRGYIFENQLEEERLVKQLLELEGKMPDVTFIICVTYACNLDCTYCFEKKSLVRGERILSKDEVDKIFECVEIISAERKFKNIHILLYGGEPLLKRNINIVEYIFSETRKRNYRIQAITNGTELSVYKDLFKRNLDIMSTFQITLDGTKQIHNKTRKYYSGKGSYEHIVENVDYCVALGMPITLRINVGKENIGNIGEVLKLICEKGWNRYKNFLCHLAPITDHLCNYDIAEWMPEPQILQGLLDTINQYSDGDNKINIKLGTDMEKHISRLRNIIDNKNKIVNGLYPCAAAIRNYFIFGIDGYIYACPETVGLQEYSIGKYVPKFYISEEKERIWKRNVTNIDNCKNCNIAGACGGGCIWSSIATRGKNFEHAQCNFAEETIDTYFDMIKSDLKFI